MSIKPMSINSGGAASGSPGEVVQQGFYQGLIIASQWPDLAERIQQAVDGDAGALADVADNGPNGPQNPDNEWAAPAPIVRGPACDPKTFGVLVL